MTLSWLVLFVLSIMFQYTARRAEHGPRHVRRLELDGNTATTRRRPGLGHADMLLIPDELSQHRPDLHHRRLKDA
jgi:hypothetical protein